MNCRIASVRAFALNSCFYSASEHRPKPTLARLLTCESRRCRVSSNYWRTRLGNMLDKCFAFSATPQVRMRSMSIHAAESPDPASLSDAKLRRFVPKSSISRTLSGPSLSTLSDWNFRLTRAPMGLAISEAAAFDLTIVLRLCSHSWCVETPRDVASTARGHARASPGAKPILSAIPVTGASEYAAIARACTSS